MTKKAPRKKATKKKATKKKVVAKKPHGRPSKYTPALARKICAMMATGRTLRSICREPGMPAESTVRNWALEDVHGFFAQYAQARDIGLDAMADELMDIADDGSNDWMERHGQDAEGYALNGEHVTRSRLRVDTRKWYLAKLAPKRYSDRLQVDQTVGLEDLTDEELQEAMALQLKQMQAEGIDIKKLIGG